MNLHSIEWVPNGLICYALHTEIIVDCLYYSRRFFYDIAAGRVPLLLILAS